METYEIDHLAAVRALAPECMVLLRSNGAFPLTEPGEIALFGSGARHTIKGGTGSGDVNSRHVTTIEEGLETAGFTIVTRPWLEAYDRIRLQAHQDFIAGIRAEAAKRGVPAIMVGMGSVMPEPEYTIPLDIQAGTDPHAAVYVLSRTSGEGSDRTPEAGDLRLTDTEIRDILNLNGRFERFLLVLNVGGVVDLSPLDDVANILLLSQLGVTVGDAFADVLLGRAYPSGKLATTWAAWDEGDQIGDFGDPDDTHYREGIYVGYRFYDSVGKEPLFPFGFGLGYTTFDVQTRQVSLDGARVSIDVDVTNTGGYPGKETIQVYASVPAGRLDQPLQALAGFTKTDEITPGATARITVDVDLTDLASYDEAARATVLEAGSYLLRAGTSSRQLSPVTVVELAQDATVRHLTGDLGEPGFTDWKPEAPAVLDIPAGLPVLTVDPADLRLPDHAEPDEQSALEGFSEAHTLARGLSDNELIYTVLGDYRRGEESDSIVGAASTTVVGAAGQTTTRIPGLPSIIMADGPAGLRLAPTYGVDAEGPFSLGDSSLPATFLELMDDAGREALGIADEPEPREPAEIREQYATAIPIGTALAQSWNPCAGRATRRRRRGRDGALRRPPLARPRLQPAPQRPVRTQLRVPLRGPAVGWTPRRRHHPRGPGPPRAGRDHQAPGLQQPGDQPPQLQQPGQPPSPARPLPARLRDLRAPGPPRRRHDLLQPHQRRPHLRVGPAARGDPAPGVGLRWTGHDRLGRSRHDPQRHEAPACHRGCRHQGRQRALHARRRDGPGGSPGGPGAGECRPWAGRPERGGRRRRGPDAGRAREAGRPGHPRGLEDSRLRTVTACGC